MRNFEANSSLPVLVQPKEENIKDYLEKFFGILSPRTYNIIEYRYGLITGKKVTLQEIAELLNVTRERIRQIERQGLRKLAFQLPLDFPSSLFVKINNCINIRGGLISKSRLSDELKDVLIETKYNAESLIDLLSVFFDKKYRLYHKEERITQISTIIDGWSTSAYDLDQILHASKKVLSILTNSETPLQWKELFPLLTRENGLLSLDEKLAHAILLCMSDNQQVHYKVDGGWCIGCEEKQTRQSRLSSILRQIGEPAHFSKISKRYNQVYPDLPQSEHNVHAVLSGQKEFVRVGRGKYGLAEWGLNDDGNVGNAIRRILFTKGRPMSRTELMDEVLKTWDVQNSAIIAAIESDARFAKTDDGLIYLTKIGLTIKKRIKREDETRLNRVEVVLRNMGSPHSVSMITKKHNLLYSDKPLTPYAVKSLMFQNPDLFIRTSRDCFGMAEWNLAPYQKEENKTVNDTFEIIREYGPLTIGTIIDIYERKFPDRQISERVISKNLEILKIKFSTLIRVNIKWQIILKIIHPQDPKKVLIQNSWRT